MKKNGLAKIFAILALIGISISIVGTGILVIMSSNQEAEIYTAEEFKNLINISTGSISTGSGDLSKINNATGSMVSSGGLNN